MKIVKLLSLILIVMLFLIACGCTQPAPPPQGSSTSYTDVTPAEAKTLIDTRPDLVIIDVSPYSNRGHLPGAISIPVSDLSSRLPDLTKNDRTLSIATAMSRAYRVRPRSPTTGSHRFTV